MGETEMPACASAPADRRKQARLVGNDLVKNYGRKRYYTPLEIRNANRRQQIQVDVGCWSYAMFASREDFDAYHLARGETCDYVAMKSEMVSSVSSSGDGSWFDIDVSWLEFPQIDWSVFDFFDLS
jgi:hypothetical protein